MSSFTIESLTANIMVESVNRSIEFYCEQLGFEKFMSVPESGTLDWAWIKKGEASLMIQSRKSIVEDMGFFKEEPTGGTLSFYMRVKNLEDLFNSLPKSICVMDMRTTFYGAKEFGVKDPDGYLLTFAEDVESTDEEVQSTNGE